MAQQPIEVLYEDNHLLAINKPSGLLVQGDVTGDEPLVEIGKQYIKEKYHKPGAVFLGVVHRLDRPVSGVVIFARTSKALARMNQQFKDKTTEKIYWAIVARMPHPPEGHLVHWLVKDESKNKTAAYIKEHPQGKRSELFYKTISTKEGYSLIEVRPITGRPHQIRVQLSTLGCPIVGDVKYGYSQPNGDGSILLHAYSLSFRHPVTKEIVTIKAQPPAANGWLIFS